MIALRAAWIRQCLFFMATQPELIVVTLPGGRRVDAQVGTHTIHTDQPRDNGGEDLAPAPFDVFLASIGACAGIFVQGFCAKRDIPTATPSDNPTTTPIAKPIIVVQNVCHA